MPDEISDGFSRGPAANQFPETLSNRLVGNLVISRVEFDTLTATRVGEQHFSIQPRCIRSLPTEEVLGPLQETEDCPRLIVVHAGGRHAEGQKRGRYDSCIELRSCSRS